MSIVTGQTGNFTIKGKETAFVEGQLIHSINILLQGKLNVFISALDKYTGISENEVLDKSYRIFSVGQNIFLGTGSFFLSKKYSVSFQAAEDSIIYTFPVQNMEQLKSILNTQKDYPAYIITSISNMINLSHAALSNLERLLNSLVILTDNLIVSFWVLKEKYGFSCVPSGKFFRDGLDNLEKLKNDNFDISGSFDAAFLEKDHFDSLKEIYSSIDEVYSSKIEYYKHISNLPVELRKSFFSADAVVANYHCRDAEQCLEELLAKLKEAFLLVEQYIKRLCSEVGENILEEYACAAMEIGKNNNDTKAVLQIIDYIIARLKKTVLQFNNEYCHELDFSPEYLDIVHNDIKASVKAHEVHVVIEADMDDCSIPDELINSAETILAYSGIPRDRAEFFLNNLEAFRDFRDKLSTDNAVRIIRNNISSVFFDVYKAVFKKVRQDNNNSPLFNMFLTYAYMDEKLLDTRHVVNLYRLATRQSSASRLPVHGIKEWLSKIYGMEREPSINEFGQNYSDVLREIKKRGDTADKDKQAYDNDAERRLDFEINNMFKTNQRLCHGQTSVYFPILHNEMITKDLSKAAVTPEMIAESVNKVLEIDFSAFHREISYRDAERGIEKEYIIKQVFPEFVLIPTFGFRGVMWQEITERNRSAPGRFLLPAFTSENLDAIIARLIGNFRWEMCRTMMGVAWNDVTQKSLTSEYTDYIQFIKKNRDLSEEAKEKVKAQAQKYNSRMRDIFTSDYETWINYESRGAVRLNKVARGILYRYCPFTRPLRENFEKQPLFSEIAIQFRNLRSKQARELENHYNSKFIKAGIPLDTDLENNLIFYKEM